MEPILYDWMYRVITPMMAKAVWYRLHVEYLEQESLIISSYLREKMCYVVTEKQSN